MSATGSPPETVLREHSGHFLAASSNVASANGMGRTNVVYTMSPVGRDLASPTHQTQQASVALEIENRDGENLSEVFTGHPLQRHPVGPRGPLVLQAPPFPQGIL